MQHAATYKWSLQSLWRAVILKIRADETQWQLFHSFLSTVTLEDGSTSSDVVMRRKVNGKWVYRLPTQEEFEDYDEGRAW